MTEALVVYLSRIEDLRVRQAPASPLDVKALGDQFEVGSVVFGSVQLGRIDPVVHR